MTLGERIIELADQGFAINFERQDAVIGSYSVIVMRITRGAYRRYFALDPYAFRYAVSSSDVDNFLLEMLNKNVCAIISKENEELAAK